MIQFLSDETQHVLCQIEDLNLTFRVHDHSLVTPLRGHKDLRDRTIEGIVELLVTNEHWFLEYGRWVPYKSSSASRCK
jgi:hypothetical protein